MAVITGDVASVIGAVFGEGYVLLPTRKIRHRTGTDQILPWISATGLAIAVGIAYFFAAQLSLALLDKTDGVALFWPAAGVSSGVLIGLGRAARLPVVSGVIVATIVANLMGDRSVWNAAASAIWNTGEALLAAWLVERYFGSSFALDRLRNVLGLLAAAVVATAVSGIGGMASFKLFQSPAAPAWTTWLHWFASDSVGIITVAPLMIGLAKAPREPPPRNEILDGVAGLGALAAVIVIAIVLLPPEPWKTVRPTALLLPVVLWLAARCQPVFAATAAFIGSLAIVWTMTFGVGHFGDPRLPIFERILDARVTIVAFTVYAYVLAALFAERRQAEARLREALAAGAVMAFECNPSSGMIERSENAAQILGLGPKQIFTAAQFVAQIHPDDCAGVEAHRRQVRADSRADAVTFRFIRPDGREVWLEETARAEFDTTGRLIRIRGLTRDVTRRKQSEKRQDVLVAELDHRVKNVLARVAAVVRHTHWRGGTTENFAKALEGRIQAMAAAHALLSQSRWSDVGLTDLIRRQLAPYSTDANATVSGPDVLLTPPQTQAVAMVIHELVTNAAKHGALSSANGRVSVSWDRLGTDNLTITWRELGGRPIAGAVPSGYGLSLIRDLIPYELGGAVELTFRSEGVCCEIEIPLRAFAAAQAATPAHGVMPLD